MQKTIRSRAFAAALLYGAAALMGASTAAAAPTPKLTRSPSLSLDSIAFLHADDIWIAPRNGGTAIRLTTDGKARGGPVFSPDGQEIAYAAQASGNSTDIFVVPAKGGVPRRVTWHPDSEAVAGWTPDGKDIVFASARAVGVRSATQLFRTAADGEGAPIALPLPLGQTMSFSPDATKVAYTPLGRRSWKGYRGGTAPYIWIADLKTLDVVKVPHTDASDWNPMWIGGKVYFLSDRDGPIGLYAFDVTTNAVTRVLENTGAFEFQSAQAGHGGIVIDALDSLKLFDPATAKVRTIAVKIPDAQTLGARKVDLPGRRAVTKALSPDGSTYAIEARGEISPRRTGPTPRPATSPRRPPSPNARPPGRQTASSWPMSATRRANTAWWSAPLEARTSRRSSVLEPAMVSSPTSTGRRMAGASPSSTKPPRSGCSTFPPASRPRSPTTSMARAWISPAGRRAAAPSPTSPATAPWWAWSGSTTWQRKRARP
jgi:tricorn protease